MRGLSAPDIALALGITERTVFRMGLEDSIAAIEATGLASTATKAEVADMTNAGFAAMDNLKVSAAELAKAFGVMAANGKQGSYELKDVARNFPELTAAASALEMKGVPAVASLSAALQIAMKSAGSADQAANNMSNFLGKITSGDTAKNFKKLGIDIEKEMKTAAASGVDPLLRMLELVDKATDGGDQFKMSKLFADKEAKDFLRALIPNLEEFKRIRDEVSNAEGSSTATGSTLSPASRPRSRALQPRSITCFPVRAAYCRSSRLPSSG